MRAYNSYSEPSQITLPTGGKIRYTHGAADPATGSGGVIDNTGNPYVYRRVLTRDVYPDGVNLEQHAVYTPAYSNGSFGSMPYWLTTVTVDHYDGTGIALAHNKHYFYGGPNNPNVYTLDIPYAFWLDAKEYQTDELAAGGAAVQSVSRSWQQRICDAGDVCLSSSTIDYSNRNGSLSPTDPRVAQVTTTLPDTNQVSLRTLGYDRYNNTTDQYEFDYGAGASGPLLRRTHTVYATGGYESNSGTHLPSLISQETIYDGSGAMLADTRYFYDQTGLTPRPNISGYNDPGIRSAAMQPP